jgi:hypothetical protein
VGSPADSFRTYIGVSVNRRDFERRFDSVQEAGVQLRNYCAWPQQSIPIYVARGPRFPVTADWPSFKIFDETLSLRAVGTSAGDFVGGRVRRVIPVLLQQARKRSEDPTSSLCPKPEGSML